MKTGLVCVRPWFSRTPIDCPVSHDLGCTLRQPAAKKKTTRRDHNAMLRRNAIIDAALDEFAQKGFAAARMEDIAKRAGVAKGTIYLNFNDKEALFEAIVNQEIRPNIDALASIVAGGGSLRDFLDKTLLPLLKDLARTRRGAVLRLLLSEAGRFPKLAEVYYRLVIAPGRDLIRSLLVRAKDCGELEATMLVQFPQLLFAPMPLSLMWAALFERFEHVDVERMARAYFDFLLGGGKSKRAASSREKRKARHA